MSKRARASGLGDVNPQILTLNTIGVGPDVYSVDQVALPVARIGGAKTKAVVFEILSVNWYLAIGDVGNLIQTNFATLSTVVSRIDGDAASDTTFATDFGNPVNFAGVFSHRAQVGATGGAMEQYPIHIDLTDQDGNGMLVATQAIIIMGGNTSGTAATPRVSRSVNDTLNSGDYLGVVLGGWKFFQAPNNFTAPGAIAEILIVASTYDSIFQSRAEVAGV